MYNKLLHRFSLILTLSTFGLIIAGGLVTSTGSGLSVPDWPLSYGTVTPPMVGGIRFEHSHRVIAFFVALFTLVLSILLFFKDKRKWMKKLGFVALGAVILQALLGGLTVIYLLPTPVSVSHACLGQSFLTLLFLMTYFQSKEWHDSERLELPQNAMFKRLCIFLCCIVYLQLILGAIVRHTQGEGVVFHIINAIFVVGLVVYTLVFSSMNYSQVRPIFKLAILLSVFVLIQFFLGIGAFVFTRMVDTPPHGYTAGHVFFRTAHQSIGALVLAKSFMLMTKAHRLLKSS